jgi:hypothetical protein
MTIPPELAALCPRAGSPVQAAALVTQLGGIPLHSRMAAAYLIRTGRDAGTPPAVSTFTGYRVETVLRNAPPLDAAVELALERLDEEGLGQTRTLLRSLAVLPPTPVPYRMLLDPDLLAGNELFPRLTAQHLEALLDGMTDLALIDRETPETLTVDPRIGAYMQGEARRSGQWPSHLLLMAELINAATAAPETSGPLAPAAEHVFRSLVREDHDPDDVDLLANACLHIGETLASAGRFAEARAIGMAVVAGARRVLGPTHTRTLLGTTFLAGWTGNGGDPAAACDLLVEVVAAYRPVPDPVDPDTLIAFSNLAYWAGKAGDAAAARDANAELVLLRTRAAGPDDLDVLFDRGELAHWTGMAGDAAAAHDMFTALLPDLERALGSNAEDVVALRKAIIRWET